MSKCLKSSWDKIIGRKQETYAKAINSLLRIEEKIATIDIKVRDINFKNFKILKNVWTDLPSDISTGISCMALHIGDDYTSLLAYFQPHSRIEPHQHTDEWEVIKILEGSAYDESNDISLIKGDVYIIPKGKKHNIITTSEECYLYTLFTADKKYLVLPHNESDSAKNKITQNLVGIDYTQINVLYIDDDVLNLEMCKMSFKNEGINIFTALNYKTALDILNTNTIHVLLCDYNMPEMNGTDTIIAIHKQYPKVIPIAVTSHYDTEILDDLTYNAGVTTCHPKPWNREVLLHSIVYSYSQYVKS